jgi:glycosyltransferase involved in cell wall biosynthesis
MITIAVTTFNRRDIVGRALNSALDFAAAVGGKVVLVDDGSTDGTETAIKHVFCPALTDGSLAFFRHEANLGVTAAKNTAFGQSQAGWVLFLDSDDELMQESASAVADVLANHRNEPLVFFRCVDEDGALVGRGFAEPQRLSLQRYTIHTSYGEALVAINKAVASALPFDAELRGYEGIGCARLIEQFGPALLSTVRARRYDRTRHDRLSGFVGTLKRADRLARGHRQFLKLFRKNMRYSTQMAMQIKVFVYLVAGLLASTVWSRNG